MDGPTVNAWLKQQWRAAANSYDQDEALSGSHPGGTAVAAGALGAVLGAVGYVPYLASRAQIVRPWIPLVLTAVAALVTLTAWRHKCRGPIGTTATLGDNAIYSAALTYAAANASEQWGIGLAVVHGLMVLAFASQAYGLTLPFAAAMGLPLAVVLLTSSPAPIVLLVLVCTYVLVLLLSFMTGRRHALLQEQARLHQAVDATRLVADESVQMALTTTLLGLGHFLHELRNAQAAMQANLDFIRMSTDLSDDAREALEDAITIQQTEQDLVVETIGQLRDQSKSTNTVFLLYELVEAVAQEESAHVKVKVEGSKQRFVLTGTPQHLRIVLTNLIRNAEQAGATEVRLALRLEPSGQAVRLNVYDDGPGLPDDLSETFLPFVVTEKAAGSGLGLYLCRRYVALFGGTIEVDESPLGGAAFRLTLPGKVLGKEASPPPPDVSADATIAKTATQ